MEPLSKKGFWMFSRSPWLCTYQIIKLKVIDYMAMPMPSAYCSQYILNRQNTPKPIQTQRYFSWTQLMLFFFFFHLQQYKIIVFKTVGNSATQILNKEISPSLSGLLSRERDQQGLWLSAPYDFPWWMSKWGIEYKKDCYPLQFPTWPVASLLLHLPDLLQYLLDLHPCLPHFHLCLPCPASSCHHHFLKITGGE